MSEQYRLCYITKYRHNSELHVSTYIYINVYMSMLTCACVCAGACVCGAEIIARYIYYSEVQVSVSINTQDLEYWVTIERPRSFLNFLQEPGHAQLEHRVHFIRKLP